jgi:hypothetical protein
VGDQLCACQRLQSALSNWISAELPEHGCINWVWVANQHAQLDVAKQSAVNANQILIGQDQVHFCRTTPCRDCRENL